MTRIQYYASIFMVLAMFATNIYAQATIVIRFSHVSEPDSPKGMAASYFKQQAEEITKGKVRVDIYPNGTMFEDDAALEALQLGMVEMMVPPPAKIAKLGLNEFELFDIPYLFPNREAIYRVTQGPVGYALLQKLESKGIVGLGFWDNGFKNMFTDKPVRTPDDMRGLKMRVDSSKTLVTQMELLGAIPYAISFAQMIDLLRKNVIDGLESTPSNLYARRNVNMPKYVTVTNHGYLGYTVIANKKFWEQLRPEIRTQLQSAVNETTKYANQIAQQKNEADLASMKQSRKTTVIELNDAEKAKWQKALFPVQKAMDARIGPELMKAVHQAIGTRTDYRS